MELVTILQSLYNNGIKCGVSSFCLDGQFKVWIGNESNGIMEEANFNANELDAIPSWLLKATIRLFPEFKFIKKI